MKKQMRKVKMKPLKKISDCNFINHHGSIVR